MENSLAPFAGGFPSVFGDGPTIMYGLWRRRSFGFLKNRRGRFGYIFLVEVVEYKYVDHWNALGGIQITVLLSA